MAYSDFDLRSVSEQFSLTIIEDVDLFSSIPEVAPGEGLQQMLDQWVPVALATNTEKARCEMIVAPILMEVVRLTDNRISLFSGITFDVDKSQGLNGACDYLLSRSKERFFLNQPVFAIVEAKKEDIAGSLGQCVAEMLAAQKFNSRREEEPINQIYGAVTTGSIWRFLRLEGSTLHIDRPEYYLHPVGKILAILLLGSQ